MRILTHTVTEADSGQTVRQLLGRLWHISGGFLTRHRAVRAPPR